MAFNEFTTIAEAWEACRTESLYGVPENLANYAKRYFYAGAAAAYGMTVWHGDGAPSEADMEIQADKVLAIRDELKVYFQALAAAAAGASNMPRA